MAFRKELTIAEYQEFVREIYGLNNDRFFNTEDMLTQIQRFVMRGLKGIRKNDKEKIKNNLLISTSWFMSLLNQLHIKIESEVWKRFPYVCSYCAFCPCECKTKRPQKRQKLPADGKKRPRTLGEFQEMFERIYPSKTRNLEAAGIHLAEELGEFSESILHYRGQHKNNDFDGVRLEAADLLSCFFAVFNSLNLSVAKELSKMYSDNCCHNCKKNPCQCSFETIMKFKS